MITKIQINDNLYVELESMHHGYIVFKQSIRIIFNIVNDCLDVNVMHDLPDQVLKQVVKKLNLKGIISTEEKLELNKKRKEKLNKIIKDTTNMDRWELRRFKDVLSEVEKWIRLE